MSKGNDIPLLTRGHRILIGVVVIGAVVIAGIGFVGSYAAVRELAVRKGFRDFSHVFPIGIDAGICVLLALDLLLTWIRMPFPMLRQTAWLLTAATIAFNGAAAWPDPLGVGMHAVMPVLFVVAAEAARHAIGRIADITADKHMEGVRVTRWLLSPIPTFLLWRRMKLWELRSYDQVIRREQERLIYQAQLRSRFGRAWRRKAPVESLMPLRLAGYGVPLRETAPAGLSAAGIHELPIQLTVDRDRTPVPSQRQSPALEPAVDLANDPAIEVRLQDDVDEVWVDEQQEGEPATPEPEREETVPGRAEATEERGMGQYEPEQPSPQGGRAAGDSLTVVDRYYLVWMEYQFQHGREPGADELSTFLAERGRFGRGRKPVSPSTLRRYPLHFRMYNVWAEHRAHTEVPSADAVAQDCATRGITAQYNKPITPAQIAEQTDDFERRWRVLVHQYAEALPQASR